jgi:hypothetical protein
VLQQNIAPRLTAIIAEKQHCHLCRNGAGQHSDKRFEQVSIKGGVVKGVQVTCAASYPVFHHKFPEYSGEFTLKIVRRAGTVHIDGCHPPAIRHPKCGITPNLCASPDDPRQCKWCAGGVK